MSELYPENTLNIAYLLHPELEVVWAVKQQLPVQLSQSHQTDKNFITLSQLVFGDKSLDYTEFIILLKLLPLQTTHKLRKPLTLFLKWICAVSFYWDMILFLDYFKTYWAKLKQE